MYKLISELPMQAEEIDRELFDKIPLEDYGWFCGTAQTFGQLRN